MKNDLKKVIVFSLLVVIVSCHGSKLHGQEYEPFEGDAYFSAGFGILDLLNLGFVFGSQNTQVGIKIGTIPFTEESLFSFSGDISYHFAGSSKKVNMNTWYGKAGIQYYSEVGDDYHDKMTFFNPRIGKKFFFTEKFGFEIEGGIMILLLEDEYYKNPPFIDFNMTFFPGFAANFFIPL